MSRDRAKLSAVKKAKEKAIQKINANLGNYVKITKCLGPANFFGVT